MWYIPEYIDPNSVDRTWKPPQSIKPYIYHFLSQHTNTDSKRICVGVSGVTYTVPGALENQIVFDMKVRSVPVMNRWKVPEYIDESSIDFTWHPNAFDPPYIYHFPSQWHISSGVTYTVPGATEIKFVKDFIVKSIPVMHNWFVPYNADISTFDFSWHPNSIEKTYEYRFPTQHQRDGGPVYKGTAGVKYCNQQTVKVENTQIFYIDFFNTESAEQFQQLQKIYPDIKKIRYVDNHLNVFKRIISLAKSEFIWIASSVCDYIGSNFDFTWHPEESQREMIHCFASGDQKRGDTFFIHVESFKNQAYNLELLDWFNVINYVIDISVLRFDWPVQNYNDDNLVDKIKNYKFNTPYAVFTNQQNCYPNFNPCLWSEKDRVIESFTNSKAICCVPRDAKAYIKSQVYDYPYISNDEHKGYFAETPLDIVYISNGEPNEQEYYDHLQYQTPANFHIGRLHWIKGITGRSQAYKEAANASTTPWFFAVFAKLRVDPLFNFKWQPDYFQSPKHYIFHAKNPLNGLEYGHQAMIAYNKKLVMDTIDIGLDFTLSAPHEVVPILSGIAEFNQDPWMTWRTAFREVIKLKKFTDELPSIENIYRLKKWLTVAEGAYAEWCLKGANDAIEYYNTVSGDFNLLKLSYEWAWLKQYFENKY